LAGSYDNKNEALLNLPSIHSSELSESLNKDNKEKHYCHSKVLDPNNSAYVDGFFSYLSSQILHAHDFIHGIDFYGSYLAIQKDFIVNIYDDQEYLIKNDFFKDKNGVLFYYDETECENVLSWNQERRERNGENKKQTKSKNSKIKILNAVEINAVEINAEQLQIQNNNFENDENSNSVTITNYDQELHLVDVSNSDIFKINDDGDSNEENQKINNNCNDGCDSDDTSSSSCSSRSSHTTNESLYNMSDGGESNSQDEHGSHSVGSESEYDSECEELKEDEEILNDEDCIYEEIDVSNKTIKSKRINDEDRITINRLTKYERAKIICARSQ